MTMRMVPTREEEIESIERSERGGGEYCIYSLYIERDKMNEYKTEERRLPVK
mgnify:CR=1 FL=1